MERFILEISNFIPSNLCNQIITRFDKSDSKIKGSMTYKSGNETIVQSKSNYEMNISETLEFSDLDKELSRYVMEASQIYMLHLKTEFDYDQQHHMFNRFIYNNTSDIGYTVHKVEPGDSYDWHIDADPMHTGFAQMIIYLNTLDPDDGGTTEFLNGYKVKPQVGKILFFPRSWIFGHRGNKVNNKNKFLCTSLINYNLE